MDIFRGRSRQRNTPRLKVRHTSVTPNFRDYNYSPAYTSARPHVNERSFPYRRPYDTAPQSRPWKRNKKRRGGKRYENRNFTNSNGFPEASGPNPREVSRTGPPTRFLAQYHQRPRTVSFHNDGGRTRDFVSSRVNTPRYFTNRNVDRQYPPPRNTNGTKQGRLNVKKHLRQNPDFKPAPPQLKNTIKLFYELIRLIHHLENVTTKVENNLPITFSDLTDLLIETVRPAFSNERVAQLLQGNAKNWCYTTQLILEQHYESTIELTVEKIRTQTNRDDWPEAFEVASHWADRNYRGRVSAEAIEQAEALITAELPLTSGTSAQNVVAEPPAREPPRTYAAVVASTSRAPLQTQPPSSVQPSVGIDPVRQNVSHQNVSIQTSPTLCPRQHTVTPPPARGDWSFEEEAPPQDLHVALRPIQAVAVEPIEQRKKTHKSRHLSRVAENSLTVSLPQSRHDIIVAETSDKTPPPQSRHENPVTELSVGISPPPEVDPRVNNMASTPRGEEALPESDGGRPDPTRLPFPPISSPIVFPNHSQNDGLLFSDDPSTPEKIPSPLSLFLKELDPLLDPNPRRVEQGEPNALKRTSIPIPTATERRFSLRPLVDLDRVESPPAQQTVPPPATTTALQTVTIQASPDSPHSSSLNRPLRHISTNRKFIDWSLTIKKKTVIIGDSNLSRFPQYDDPDLQIDCFPGAKFQHASNLLEKATVSLVPDQIILSFGINNRKQRHKLRAIAEIQKAYQTARRILPQTAVIVPLINFSRALPLAEREMIEHMNRFIGKNMITIPLLAATHFRVEGDGVHWRPATAKALFTHWMDHLNF